ncbi:MAG TPA: translation initiation factor IF-3 [Candidatus Eremiobacteraceae bacterium]|nr:translation initiation factor IF-3 [Candidatus Eremiobacteraceae bacterium]
MFGPVWGQEGRFIADRFARINERIRAKEVRVIDDEGKQLGIMTPADALKLARGQGLDLVEVSPTANPPVCRVINYGKFLYQLSKRQHEAKKHQKSIELKEVKFRPQTSDNDFNVKRNHILEFLKAGDKVKATIMFKGRQMAHRELGWNMIQRLITDVGAVGLVESRPKQEGPNLTAVLAPKKTGGKAPASRPAGSGAPGTRTSSGAAPARPKAAEAGAVKAEGAAPSGVAPKTAALTESSGG